MKNVLLILLLSFLAFLTSACITTGDSFYVYDPDHKPDFVRYERMALDTCNKGQLAKAGKVDCFRFAAHERRIYENDYHDYLASLPPKNVCGAHPKRTCPRGR